MLFTEQPVMCELVPVQEGFCGFAYLFPFVLFSLYASASFFHFRVKVILGQVENTFWPRDDSKNFLSRII